MKGPSPCIPHRAQRAQHAASKRKASLLWLAVPLVAGCAALSDQADPVSTNTVGSRKPQAERSDLSAQPQKDILTIDESARTTLDGRTPGGESSTEMGPQASAGARLDHAVGAQRNDQLAHRQIIPPSTTSGRNDGAGFGESSARRAFAIVRVTPVEDTVSVGQEVSLHVEVLNVADLYSAPFYLLFDPDLFEVVAFREGEFLKRDGDQTVLLQSVDKTGGRVIVGLSRLGRLEGLSGSGVLLTVSLKAKRTGAGTVSLHHVEFVDSTLAPLAVASESALIRVQR